MRIKIPIRIIELEPNNFHIIAEAKFSNLISGLWVIDTGASKTVFDKNLSDSILEFDEHSEEIHSAGIQDEPIKAEFAILKPFMFRKKEIKDLKVALLDLKHINDLYQKSTNIKICGLLGGDFLMNYKALIDYRKRIMILHD